MYNENTHIAPSDMHTRMRPTATFDPTPEHIEPPILVMLEREPSVLVLSESLRFGTPRKARSADLHFSAALFQPCKNTGAVEVLEAFTKADDLTHLGGIPLQMVEHVEKRKCDVTQSTPALDQLASAKTDTSRLSNICSKPECAVIEIGDCCVEGKSERDVTTNTNTATIAYIDEEEHEFADKGESVMLSKEPTSAVPHSYTKGNIVHELHALNESDKEDGFDNEVSSWSRTSVLAEHSKVLNTVDNNCPRVGLDYDENPFAYTWGHLRVRSNKHGSYEMGNKSLAVGGEKGSSDGIGGESAHHLDGPLLPNTRAPGCAMLKVYSEAE
ncbi:hypothetical protein Tcan_13851 [Toxocara canis]|nr:hypothetical protein Tcan_13851 [Toxocara canis]